MAGRRGLPGRRSPDTSKAVDCMDPTAVDSGANTTFVLAVQVLRLFVMLLAAPVLAKWLVRGEPRPPGPPTAARCHRGREPPVAVPGVSAVDASGYAERGRVSGAEI